MDFFSRPGAHWLLKLAEQITGNVLLQLQTSILNELSIKYHEPLSYNRWVAHNKFGMCNFDSVIVGKIFICIILDSFFYH